MSSEMVELHLPGACGRHGDYGGRAPRAAGATGLHVHHGRGCSTMTAIAESLQTDVEGISAPRAVVVGIMAGEGVQIGVLLDANAPVSVMTDPLLKVVNSRLQGARRDARSRPRGAAGGHCAWSTARPCAPPSR